MQLNQHFSRRYYVFLILFLGLLSAFGPFVTDMYLPTLPSMKEVFHTTTSIVQMGLTTSMLGLAIGQVFFGPLSDKYGRRSVLVIAMILYSVSTVISIFSPSIEFFNACRFFQGLGGAGGIVLSRSIATDCYTGKDLAKTLAIVGAVNGVAPVTAPVIGGLVAEWTGWQGIFWILFGLGLILLFMCLIFRESLTVDNRHKGSVISLLKGFPQLLKNKRFTILIIFFAFTSAVLFAYISSASFIIQNYFGYSELTFSMIFGINAVGIALGSALALRFRQLFSAALFGAIGITLAALLQFAIHLIHDSFIFYESLTFLMLTFTGFIFTSTTTLAMDEGRSHIGVASAIGGASGFLFGGIVSPLVGLGNIMTSTTVILSLASLIALSAALYLRFKLKL